jgi:hypothetical protein
MGCLGVSVVGIIMSRFNSCFIQIVIIKNKKEVVAYKPSALMQNFQSNV